MAAARDIGAVAALERRRQPGGAAADRLTVVGRTAARGRGLPVRRCRRRPRPGAEAAGRRPAHPVGCRRSRSAASRRRHRLRTVATRHERSAQQRQAESDAVAAYKAILRDVLDNRPSGTRQRLAARARQEPLLRVPRSPTRPIRCRSRPSIIDDHLRDLPSLAGRARRLPRSLSTAPIRGRLEASRRGSGHPSH